MCGYKKQIDLFSIDQIDIYVFLKVVLASKKNALIIRSPEQRKTFRVTFLEV